jgi:hypothetical protein
VQLPQAESNIYFCLRTGPFQGRPTAGPTSWTQPPYKPSGTAATFRSYSRAACLPGALFAQSSVMRRWSPKEQQHWEDLGCLNQLLDMQRLRDKSTMKKDHRGFNLASKPSGNGCVECLASPKGWWFHLRRCAECGHIGCCDTSPSQHASRHAEATGHPVITSFEPGEDWFFDYEKEKMIKGVELLPPHAHPDGQPVPGPAGRVPATWESLLN